MVQVQLRIPDGMAAELDQWVDEGRFRSRSDAIKSIITIYEEREKTRVFYRMLEKRSSEAKENPDMLIPFEDI